MPLYNLHVMVKSVGGTRVKNALVRTGKKLFNEGGFIRSVESNGLRALPQKRYKDEVLQSEATYFTFKVDLPVKSLKEILEQLKLDPDLIRQDFVAIKNKDVPVCTLDQELLPPSQRPSVQKLIDQGRSKPKFTKIWESKTGLDYYPFHR